MRGGFSFSLFLVPRDLYRLSDYPRLSPISNVGRFLFAIEESCSSPSFNFQVDSCQDVMSCPWSSAKVLTGGSRYIDDIDDCPEPIHAYPQRLMDKIVPVSFTFSLQP